jgi:hypothetical protein
MPDAEGSDTSLGASDEALDAYIREFADLISFCEQDSSSHEEISRRVDDFYDKHIFDILKDYLRQFSFSLVTLKVYSVWRSVLRGGVDQDRLDAALAAASQPLFVRRRGRPRAGVSCRLRIGVVF